MGRIRLAAFAWMFLLVGCPSDGSPGGDSPDQMMEGSWQWTGPHPNSCSDTCTTQRPNEATLEAKIEEFFAAYVKGLNNNDPNVTVALDPLAHDVCRGMCKHMAIEQWSTEGGWNGECQFASTTPEGWTLADRLTMMNPSLNTSTYKEVLVTIENASENPVTNAAAAMGLITQRIQDRGIVNEAENATLVGAGTWRTDGMPMDNGTVAGSTIRVSLIFAQ